MPPDDLCARSDVQILRTARAAVQNIRPTQAPIGLAGLGGRCLINSVCGSEHVLLA